MSKKEKLIKEKEKYLKDELVYSIIDEFENILEKHNIIIPSEDDDGTDDFRSNLYGSEYYELEDKIKNKIDTYNNERNKFCSIIKK